MAHMAKACSDVGAMHKVDLAEYYLATDVFRSGNVCMPLSQAKCAFAHHN